MIETMQDTMNRWAAPQAQAPISQPAGNEWFGGNQAVQAQDMAAKNQFGSSGLYGSTKAQIGFPKRQGMISTPPIKPQMLQPQSALPEIGPTTMAPLFDSKPKKGSMFQDSTGYMQVL
jgi:hypothetical protein